MMCERGVDEIKTLFELVGDAGRHAADDGPDRCDMPSLDCRLRAIVAGMGMLPPPDCAVPDRHADETAGPGGRD